MSKLSSLFTCAAAAGASLLLFSCSKSAEFAGYWSSITPTDFTMDVTGASKASSSMTFNFVEDNQKTGGNVNITNNLDVTKAIEGDSLSSRKPYTISFKASAQAAGTWAYDVDDDDDILLDLDLSKMTVNIDENSVTFSQPFASEVPKAQLDSISDAYIPVWKQELEQSLSSNFSRFTVIDDIDVEHGGKILEFEIKSPKEKLQFKKVEQ